MPITGVPCWDDGVSPETRLWPSYFSPFQEWDRRAQEGGILSRERRFLQSKKIPMVPCKGELTSQPGPCTACHSIPVLWGILFRRTHNYRHQGEGIFRTRQIISHYSHHSPFYTGTRYTARSCKGIPLHWEERSHIPNRRIRSC